MPDDKCKWKSKYYLAYECHEPPLEGDEKGWCILHSEREDKNIEEFKKKVEERLKGEEKIDLRGCYFPEKFPADYFEGCTFDRPVDFSEAKFSQEADFSGAAFSQKADFSWATFSRAYFIGATFSQKAYFSGATFSEAVFAEATFSEANFRVARFSEEADFSEAAFLEEADFSGAAFSETADFVGAAFSQAYFIAARFSEAANFSLATFSQRAVFLGAAFEKGVTFDRVEFMDNAFFRPAEWEVKGGEKKIREVNLGDPTSFCHTRFLGDVVFQQVDLRHCSFLHSNIDKVDFRYCEFGKGKGRQNVLKDERDCIKNVKDADKGPFPYNGRVFMDTAEEKRARDGYESARRLYIELKKNFEEKRDWNTAGDFHYGEMECRRNMKEGWLRRNIFSLEAVYFWLSGYGERPLRAAVSLGLLIVICAVLYMYFEGLVSGFDGNYIRAFLKSGCDSIKITTLQRIGHVEEYDSLPAKAIFIFESIMGPILIALFALALRRKVKR